MTRSRAHSKQALAVLAALADASGEWLHGYDITAQAGIKSGTLYPLLMRMEAQGQLEAQWQESPTPGRPPRHIYRLTAAGRELVASLAEQLAQARTASEGGRLAAKGATGEA